MFAEASSASISDATGLLSGVDCACAVGLAELHEAKSKSETRAQIENNLLAITRLSNSQRSSKLRYLAPDLELAHEVLDGHS